MIEGMDRERSKGLKERPIQCGRDISIEGYFVFRSNA